MTNYSEMLKKIAKIIKNRFPNLSVEETIDIATQIMDALEE